MAFMYATLSYIFNKEHENILVELKLPTPVKKVPSVRSLQKSKKVLVFCVTDMIVFPPQSYAFLNNDSYI